MMRVDLLRSRLRLAFFPLLMAFLLAGCGSSGSSTTTPAAPASTLISGTAASGAPIIGTVSIRDSSSNPQPVKTGIPIAADGKYSVDVSGLTAPFAFLADGTVGGKRVQLYSAATQADVGGTINITPFTDLIVRNIAGSIATTLADAISSKLPSMTAAQLDAKRVALTAQLTPVLQAAGVSTSIDLLRATFSADSTGLDRVMDLVKVDTTVPTAITITNILDAAKPLTMDPATGTTTGGTTLSATGVSASATPTDLIVQSLNSFSTYFATSLPSPTDANLLAMFSSTFLDNGRNVGAFLTEMTTNKALIGLKFTNVVVDSIDTTNNVAQVHFMPLTASGTSVARDMPGGAIAWEMKLENGAWKANGDQRIATVRVRTTADKWVCASGSGNGCTAGTTYSTGLNLEIDDKGMIGIGSAVVTGPGLPTAGVTLTAQPNRTWLSLPVAGCSGCSDNNYKMADTDIANIAPNSTYTVKLYSNAATPALLATYTEVLPVAPVLNTKLAGMSFPSIATSGMTSMMNFTSGTLTPNWTIPTGLWGDIVAVNVYQNGTGTSPGPNQFVMANLDGQTANSGTSTLVVTAPTSGSWTNGNLWIDTYDQYGGHVDTNYQ